MNKTLLRLAAKALGELFAEMKSSYVRKQAEQIVYALRDEGHVLADGTIHVPPDRWVEFFSDMIPAWLEMLTEGDHEEAPDAGGS